jgi:hypothetical protein
MLHMLIDSSSFRLPLCLAGQLVGLQPEVVHVHSTGPHAASAANDRLTDSSVYLPPLCLAGQLGLAAGLCARALRRATHCLWYN